MGLFKRGPFAGDLYKPMDPVHADAGTKSAATMTSTFMSKAPGLVESFRTAGVSLEKKGGLGLRAAVYLVVDRSGSMTGYFNNGAVQTFADRILAAAAQFDDDGIVPTVFFGSSAHPVKDIVLGQHTGRVAELHREFGGMGTTNYAAAMETVIQHYRSTNPRVPALVFFQTDGAPNSEAEAETIIVKSSKLPIFWQFVGFGRDNFTFLNRLDTMSGRAVDNAGFFAAGTDPTALSDAQLYDKLLNEYPSYVRSAQHAGIISR